MVFQTVGIPIATSVLEGYNGTIFAYGQTGTGKTYTMQGPFFSVDEYRIHNDFQNKKYLGLIPRIISYIFAQINQEKEKFQEKPPIEYLCQASYCEIYNEQIFDLLTDSTDSLNIHGIYINININFKYSLLKIFKYKTNKQESYKK